MSGQGDRPGPKGFEIPDLDLPPPRASQSSLKAVIPPDSGRSPVSGTARATAPLADELSDLALTGPSSLDLELEAPISRAGAAAGIVTGAQFAEDGFELEPVRARTQAPLVVAAEGRANWPMGVTPARESLVLDPVEVRVLADFGAPPAISPLNAVYAVRVMLRKNALKAGLRRAERELAEAEATRDARLAELAEQKLPELSKSDTFRRALQPLADIDTRANDRTRALAAANDEQSAGIGQLDAEVAAIQRDLETEHAARAKLATELAACEQSFRRVEARHKRCFIEMRAIEQQAAQRLGPAGGEMPADLFEKLAPLKAQAEALRPELEQARAAYEAAKRQDEAHARAIKGHESRKAEFERKKSQLGDRFRRQLDTRQQGVGEVTAQRRAALADIGRLVLAARGGVSVDEGTLERLRESDATVLELARKSELHLHALDACDNDQVKSGLAWILAVFALIVALVVYRVVSG
jgi:hypothetical protein